MKLSRTIAYAVHATLELARAKPGVPIPCSQLTAGGRLPERFLLQILRSLVNRGILQSTRGVVGGYCLARSPAEISLLDLFEALDTPLETDLLALDTLSPHSRARLIMTLHAATNASRLALDQLTIADLLCSTRMGAAIPSMDITEVLNPLAASYPVDA